ncbi:nitroreductase [Myxococcota bacterium]|nr:nitroreductase [Myxococcota bacterium]MBU1432047.1 nitroreductase [Myxococcota bacterium]MBU1897285.1 nitroreductase [Myxococcota bacterium]
MNTLEIIRARRTVHKYLDLPVAPEIITRALEAAHSAPCHKRTWPWRFYVVGAQTRQALYEIALAMGGEVTPAAKASLSRKLLRPALIVATQTRSADPQRAHEDYAAVACALQNAMLSLRADGLGSKWSTGGLSRAPEAARLLGVPAEEEIVGFLWFGYPEVTPPCARPPLEGYVRRLP